MNHLLLREDTMSYDYRKLPTNRYFESLDLSARKEEFEALFSKFSEVKWSHMVTVTFQRPVTDRIVIEKFCVEYKQRLFKHLYGVSKKYRQIKILPFIESHYVYCDSQKKYHVHMLLTLPHEMRDEVSRYERCYGNRAHMFEKILKTILLQVRSANFVRVRCPVGQQFDIRPVDHSMRIVDYCLKEFRSGRPEIAWEATNISWSN